MIGSKIFSKKVVISLTINRGDEERASVEKEDGKEVQYKIYDGKREALVAEGEVVDDKIEDLFPDIENPEVFIDGMRVRLSPEQPDVPVEEADDGEKRITDMYWTYGKDRIELEEDNKTRHYEDMNLHVETENYDDGETIEFVIESNGELPAFELKLTGTVLDDKIVFENVLKEHTLNF